MYSKTSALKAARVAVSRPVRTGSTSYEMHAPRCAANLRGPSTSIGADSYTRARTLRARWIVSIALQRMGYSRIDAAHAVGLSEQTTIDDLMADALHDVNMVAVVNPHSETHVLVDVSETTQAQVDHYAAHLDDAEQYACDAGDVTPAAWAVRMVDKLGAERAGEILFA